MNVANRKFLLAAEESMTHRDSGHYSKKHPEGTNIHPRLAEAVEKGIRKGKMSCAKAHHIAEKLNIDPSQVGMALDMMEYRISECQLGLFGYGREKKVRPAETISAELENLIQQHVSHNQMTCLTVWTIANRLKLSKMDVSNACEKMKLKIIRCQLGAFP
jgi:hypothetical protein